MIPKRDRLTDILILAVPLRSLRGISTFKDLITLLKNDSQVTYQKVLRLIKGHCPVHSYSKIIKRYKHLLNCNISTFNITLLRF